MIIACEQCQTQFQLDDRRIPTGGARVRCSKCQHAFHVSPPEVVAETTLQGLVDQVVEEAIPAPEPESGMTFGQTDPGLSEALQTVDEVPPDEWTFNEDPSSEAEAGLDQVAEQDPGLDSGSGLFGEAVDLGASGSFRQKPAAPQAGPESVPPPGPAGPEGDVPPPPKAPAGFELQGEGHERVPEPAAEQRADPLDELGAPESWDFLADANPAPVQVEEVEEAPQEEPEALPEPRRAKRRPPRWFLPDSGIYAVGWVLALGLLGWGGLRVVQTGLAPVTASPIPVVLVGGGQVPSDLRAERLENLHAGPILVVSGRAPAGARAGQGLRIRLLDAAGEPLEADSAWAGPAQQEEPLREADPADLRLALQQTASSLRAGSAFQAIFELAPANAYGLELRWAAAIPTPPAAEEDQTGSPEGLSAGAGPPNGVPGSEAPGPS